MDVFSFVEGMCTRLQGRPEGELSRWSVAVAEAAEPEPRLAVELQVAMFVGKQEHYHCRIEPAVIIDGTNQDPEAYMDDVLRAILLSLLEVSAPGIFDALPN